MADNKKFCIHGALKASDPSDLEIIAQYYLSKFIKKNKNGSYAYNTGFIHDEAVFSGNYLFQIHERILLKGIIALITGEYPEFCFESFFILKENNENIVTGAPQHLCVSPRSNLIFLIHEKSDATQIYIKAIEDLNLKWVLVLFAQQIDTLPSIGWANLYSIYEIIGKDLKLKNTGKIKDFLAAELKIERSKLDNFTFLANCSRDPFEGMRHGAELTSQDTKKFNKLYNCPGAIVWASDFIRELAIKWMDYKYNIKIIKPRYDNSPLGFHENGEPMVPISKLEAYESKHYPK